MPYCSQTISQCLRQTPPLFLLFEICFGAFIWAQFPKHYIFLSMQQRFLRVCWVRLVPQSFQRTCEKDRFLSTNQDMMRGYNSRWVCPCADYQNCHCECARNRTVGWVCLLHGSTSHGQLVAGLRYKHKWHTHCLRKAFGMALCVVGTSLSDNFKLQ